MVSEVQKSIAKRKAEQYQAQKAVGNNSAANQTFSNAASSLGVGGKTASNIYKGTTQAPKPTANLTQSKPKTSTTTPTTTPYSLSKGGFGDVRPGAKGRDDYTGTGYGLSTGENIKDLSNFGGIGDKGQKFDRFGAAAEEMERTTPGFLNQRNDAYILELASRTPDFNKLDEFAQKEQIRNLLRERDTEGELFTGQRGDVDVQNTIDSIYARIGQGEQGPTIYDRAEDAYNQDITDIESQYDAEKNEFLRAGAVEDRYTNFNEVNNNINDVMLVAGQHRADNLYTGMPTDEQINEIAQQSGNDFAVTKQILEGRGFEALEMQDEFAEKSSRPRDRQMLDLETDRERNMTDTQTSHERTQTMLGEQIDDVKREMERNVAIGEKAGALSGAVRSSGYMQGLENIRNDALRQVGRLELRQDRDSSDTAKMKGRITDDFNENMTRSKQDLETALNNIKTQNGSELNQYLMEYAPSSEELTRKLNEIDEKFATESQQAFNMYLSNLRGITDTLTYDTEKMLELEGTMQNLQQTNVSNLLADNGAALAGLTMGDLGGMLQAGKISPQDYTVMSGYMNTLGMSTLQGLGVPTQQDYSMYSSLIEQGMTPMQAVSAVTSSAPERFTQVTSDANVGKVSDGFQWNTETQRYDIPVGQATTTSTQTGYDVPDYTPADINDMQEGEVFLYENGVGKPGGQCGSYVNDYLQSMGIDRLFVDPISAKTAVKNSDVPTVGGVAIIDWSNNPNATDAQKTYGHVAIIKSINNDGTLTLQDSNHSKKQPDGTYKGDEMVHERNIDANKVTGYFDPTKGKDTIQAPIEETVVSKKQLEGMMDLTETEGGSKMAVGTSDNLSAGKSDAVNAINKIQEVLNEGDYMSGLAGGALGRIPRATDTKEAKQLFGIGAQVVGKFLEGGKLAEGDIARYKKMLPDGNDTKKLAQRKLNNVKDLIMANYNGVLDTQARAGTDVSNFDYITSLNDVFVLINDIKEESINNESQETNNQEGGDIDDR